MFVFVIFVYEYYVQEKVRLIVDLYIGCTFYYYVKNHIFNV